MKTNQLEYDCAARTSIGTRNEQQDAVALFDDGYFTAVVCDGMGGLNGGKLASTITAKTLIELIKNKSDNNIPDLYLRSVDILDQQVNSLKAETGEPLRAGTTVVSIYIEKGLLYWMSVGDSRLYVIRGNEIVQITRDHNYFLSLNSMPDYYTPSESDLKKGNALISFIGMGGIEIMDISQKPLEIMANDYVLLTSDGLSKTVSEEEILEIIKSKSNVTSICEELLIRSEKNSPTSRDNTTFVLLKAKNADK